MSEISERAPVKQASIIENLEDAAEFLQALSLDKRLHILYLLVDGEVAVCALAPEVGLSQSALSHQLSILRRLGLVSARREGQKVYYRSDSAAVKKLLQALSQLFDPR